MSKISWNIKMKGLTDYAMCGQKTLRAVFKIVARGDEAETR